MNPVTGKLAVVLRSSARDVALIVAGILIAFLLDAWWNERINEEELREDLRAVHADFLSTREELNQVVAVNEAYIEGVTKLVALGPEEIERLDSETGNGLAWLLPTGGLTFDPVMGSLDAFISSGQLNRIDNLELRGLIGAWSGLIDEIGEDQDILIDMYIAQQERNVQLGIYRLLASADAAVGATDVARSVILKAIGDEEMVNRLLAHRFAVQSLNDELAAIESYLGRVLALLEREVGN